METRPPALIDAAVRLLIPPACREHVVGDLWERYSSPWQYVVDAARTLPFVVASQMRRTSDLLLLVMHVLPAFLLFGGLRTGPDVVDPAGWLRAAVPTIAVAIALVLRDAYRSPTPRSLRHATVDATVAVACALLSQCALALAAPHFLLTPRAMFGGSAGTGVMLFLLRTRMPLKTDFRIPVAANGTIAVDDFARDVRRFELTIRRRNRQEVLAAVVVIVGFAVFLWHGPEWIMRIGCGLAMAGALFIIHRIRARGTGYPIPTNVALSVSIAAYRRELERQRDLLRTVTWWYLLPLLPGMAVLMLGQALARSQPTGAFRVFGLFLVVGVLTQQLNQRAARKLQQKIDGLTALEKEV
jgi:hypothetical protein